jgi:SAM-dependent methyltransferase
MLFSSSLGCQNGWHSGPYRGKIISASCQCRDVEMRIYPSIRHKLSFLRRTPFHPQWFVFRQEMKNLKRMSNKVDGVVLDIGCSDQRIRQFLNNISNYIGMDYYQTATMWYNSRPNVFGDAQALPFCHQCIDTVILKDVLEHLPYPGKCISEIKRVLKPGGKFLLQVPFIYPTHDAPLDFLRWTIHGLRQLAHDFGFEIKETVIFGRPLETAALLTNIALCRILIECSKKRSPYAIFVVLLPFFIPIINMLAFIISRISNDDYMMPHGCQIFCVNK